MNLSSISHNSLWTVISTVPPPQSNTMTTLPFTICSFTLDSASYLHWIEAPSGSRHNNKFWEFIDSINLASTAAFLIKFLCSSLHNAGTVRTHLIFVATIFPTCSLNFCIACYPIYLSVIEMTLKSSIYLPSTVFAILSMWSKCILYWIIDKLHFGTIEQYYHLRWFQHTFEGR